MEALLDHYRIELVVFPSAGPETFCYTLTEAWSAGSGVAADRRAARACGGERRGLDHAGLL